MRNKKIIYISITISSIIILGIIGLGLKKSTKSDGNVSLESEAVLKSYQQSQETQEIDLLEQQEEQEQDAIYRAYATLAELVEDKDIPFVDDATFDTLKAAFERVEFTGDFEIGNPDIYEEYKTIFQKLLLNEIPYVDNETGEEIYIKDSDLFAPEPIDVETCEYYFFDIDGDGEQELCIHYLNWDAFFKYNAEKDEIVLCDLYTPDNRVWLLGTGKIMERESLEDDLEWIRTFYHYDELGNEVCNAYITNVLDSSYMTSMPEYAGDTEDAITEEMKAYGAYEQESGRWYFRISFEQEYELSDFFDDARDDAREKIQEVAYTYAEFFGQDQKYRLYDSMSEIEEDENVPYVDDAAFEVIKATYEKVDFFGEFEKGNPDTYDEYKRIFQKLILNEIPYIDTKTGEETYINDVDLWGSGKVCVEDYDYYFYDIDGDREQELCISDGVYEAFFKYDSEKNVINMWEPYNWGIYSVLIGTGKTISDWYGASYVFQQFDIEGNKICSTYVGVEPFLGERAPYLTSMPEYALNTEEISEGMKIQGAYARYNKCWYFRITEDQYKELCQLHQVAKEEAREEIEEVTYSYNELIMMATAE